MGDANVEPTRCQEVHSAALPGEVMVVHGTPNQRLTARVRALRSDATVCFVRFDQLAVQA
jgi:hypothetical protein